MSSAKDYIEILQISGRLTFSTDDVVGTLGAPVRAVRAQLRLLKEKGKSQILCGAFT